jgi:hypothetical protein
MTARALPLAFALPSLIVLSVSSQETPEQDAALALLAKIDGKVKFDPEHPKRVIAIDI